MSNSLALELHDAAQRVQESGGYHRLVLLVGEPCSGKTTALSALAAKTDWPRLNLNLLLSEQLLDIPTRFRQIKVADLVRTLVNARASDAVIIDNNELLFDRQLQVDPVALLVSLSRHRTVVASWPGDFDGSFLTYAEPTHPEHRRAPRPDCQIVRALRSPVSAGQPHLQVES